MAGLEVESWACCGHGFGSGTRSNLADNPVYLWVGGGDGWDLGLLAHIPCPNLPYHKDRHANMLMTVASVEGKSWGEESVFYKQGETYCTEVVVWGLVVCRFV